MEDAPLKALERLAHPSDTSGPPAITVTLISHSPGSWFEEVLTSLALQDYGRLEVLVINAGGGEGVAERVSAILPDARVVPLLRNPGFSAAANETLETEGLAPYLLVMHDDVALAPDAARRLMEEAVRSNAGIVGPKLLDWDDPTRILQVGLGADKTGSPIPLAEPGEFDQEQHDSVRDVFAVPGGAMLIRRDLFEALGGFDEAMPFYGEDIDLCWRAHVAGARVIVNPEATARHRQRLEERLTGAAAAVPPAALQRRHKVRAVLSNYSVGHSIRVIPQAIAVALGGMVLAILRGQFADARTTASAWFWNLRHLGGIVKRRRRLSAIRSLGDNEVRRFQSGGFEGLSRVVRERADADPDAIPGRARDLARRAKTRWGQVAILVWLGFLGVFVIGGRHLITRGVPVVNGLADFPEDPGALWTEWTSSWRPTGLGEDAAASSAHGLLSVAGMVFLGQMGLLRTVLTLGMILFAAAGAYRLLSPFGSIAAQLTAMVLYVSVPLPYNALVNGSWGALAMYGAAPWILRRVADVGLTQPYVEPDALTSPVLMLRNIIYCGVLLALAAAISPFAVVPFIVMATAVILGGLAMSSPGRVRRQLAVLVGALAVAVLLHIPWSLRLFTDSWASFGGAGSTAPGDFSIGELLRFETGPHGSAPLGWAVLVSAGFALVIANRARLVWAVRSWFMVIGAIGLAWLDQQEWFDVSLADTELLLVPAAVGVAFAGAMGVIAFQQDLRRYRFGWRQLVPALALASLLGTSLAGLSAALDGRWDMPEAGWEDAFTFVDESSAATSRILWIGDDDLLPVGAWSFDDQLGFAVTPARSPSLLDAWPGPIDDTTLLVSDALDTAIDGGTSRLGNFLAPFGIRWVVLIEEDVPAPFGSREVPIEPQILGRLGEQLDLERLEFRDGAVVYENSAWLPVVGSIVAGSVSPEADYAEAVRVGAELDVDPTFVGTVRRFTGLVNSDDPVYLASSASDSWRLNVSDSTALRSRAFGWANVYTPAVGGSAELAHGTALRHRLLLGGQALLWAVAVAFVMGQRSEDT